MTNRCTFDGIGAAVARLCPTAVPDQLSFKQAVERNVMNLAWLRLSLEGQVTGDICSL
jgi:hypothetical protein